MDIVAAKKEQIFAAAGFIFSTNKSGVGKKRQREWERMEAIWGSFQAIMPKNTQKPQSSPNTS
jgi:hypothetical protein